MPAAKKPPIKLKDIASDAEVSIATVSLALRNDPSITEETRRRVLEAKKRLGYSPLRKRTKTAPGGQPSVSSCKNILYCLVGFPVRKIQYADFLEGVMSACNQRKIRLEVKSIQPDEILASAELAPSNLDGVILTGDLTKEMVDFFQQANSNLVLLGNYPFQHIHSVEIDVFGMGERVAQRLVEDGHKHIVHLQRFPKNYYDRQFLMGLRDGLEVHGIRLPASHVMQVADMTAAPLAAQQVREMQPAITAITSNASNIADSCLTEIRCQQGGGGRKGIPKGYAVGLLSNESSTMGLHIFSMGMERCGWLAVEKLCHIRDTPPPFPFASVLPAAGWKD